GVRRPSGATDAARDLLEAVSIAVQGSGEVGRQSVSPFGVSAPIFRQRVWRLDPGRSFGLLTNPSRDVHRRRAGVSVSESAPRWTRRRHHTARSPSKTLAILRSFSAPEDAPASPVAPGPPESCAEPYDFVFHSMASLDEWPEQFIVELQFTGDRIDIGFQ